MAILTTKMTRKGQITIPISIRDALHMHEGDIIAVRQVDNEVVLQRANDVVDWTAGVFSEYAKNHTGPLPSRHEIWAEMATERFNSILVDE
jgi:AbrB family looped-hinge helix DNA binding protein